MKKTATGADGDQQRGDPGADQVPVRVAPPVVASTVRRRAAEEVVASIGWKGSGWPWPAGGRAGGEVPERWSPGDVVAGVVVGGVVVGGVVARRRGGLAAVALGTTPRSGCRRRACRPSCPGTVLDRDRRQVAPRDAGEGHVFDWMPEIGLLLVGSVADRSQQLHRPRAAVVSVENDTIADGQ